MNPNDELTGLGYVSSAPDFDFAPRDEVKPQDEADLPTLIKVLKVLEARKNHYRSTDALNLGVNLTIENQLIINKQMQLQIQELESLINATIIKVKEKMNERR